MATRYRKDYSQEDQETEEEVNKPQDTPEDNPEEGSFKKRYGDLRRHSQKKEQEQKDEIDRLQRELAKASSKKEYPKNEDEVREWMEKYPDLSGIIRTMILKTTEESEGPSADKIRELETRLARSDIDRQKELALREIRQAHPDFDELIDDTSPKGEKFHAWVEKQSGWVQYALYENETDSQSAIDAVDLYKSRNKPDDREERKSAAKSVRSKPSEAPKGDRNTRFSESQVNSMSDADFEKNYDKIQEAIRNGEFDYDMTGSE